MDVYLNTSLKAYNTFGIDVSAKKLIVIRSIEDLKKALKQEDSQGIFVLGGGSNMLLTQDIEATILKIDIKGKEIVSKTNHSTLIEVKAGENWHELVLWTLEQNLGGLENLSLIPGNVGTAPIQNIGAYGVELKDTFHSCKALNLETLEIHTFSLEECEFGYRSSIFKEKVKNQFVITSVCFNLTNTNHKLQTNYGSIAEILESKKIKNPGIKDISNAVIEIRQQKLPNPKELGNSGSFFKNPIISNEDFLNFNKKFPEAPYYKNSDSSFKIPAGWLIENAGLKGYKLGDAGVHKNQALVLVNYGNASGKDILNLSKVVQETVFEKYQIQLTPEVNIF